MRSRSTSPGARMATQNLKKVLKGLLQKNTDLSKGYILADLDCGPKRKPMWRARLSPCITRSRGGSGGYLVVHLGRRLKIKEALQLQRTPADVKRVGRPTASSASWSPSNANRQAQKMVEQERTRRTR